MGVISADCKETKAHAQVYALNINTRQLYRWVDHHPHLFDGHKHDLDDCIWPLVSHSVTSHMFIWQLSPSTRLRIQFCLFNFKSVCFSWMKLWSLTKLCGKGGWIFSLIHSYVWCCCRHSQNNSLLPSLRKCVYVCEASPRYESHISICQNLLLLIAWEGKKIPPSTVLIIYSAVGYQTRVSSHRQPIMRLFTQASSKPTMVFRLSLGKRSRARKTFSNSHCLCIWCVWF